MKRKTERVSTTGILLDSMIGKSLDEARQMAGFSGFSTRVVRRDGELSIITMDNNLELDNGFVTKCDIG